MAFVLTANSQRQPQIFRLPLRCAQGTLKMTTAFSGFDDQGQGVACTGAPEQTSCIPTSQKRDMGHPISVKAPDTSRPVFSHLKMADRHSQFGYKGQDDAVCRDVTGATRREMSSIYPDIE
jgi:hypothetical protein